MYCCACLFGGGAGELFVHFSSSTPPEQVGFQTAASPGSFASSLDMYFEASSFGLGLNDSRSLAPPLRVHALPSPLNGVLRDPAVSSTLLHMSGTSLIALSSAEARVTTAEAPCHCHHISPGVHYLLGVVNNPYFGHVLANTLSNLFAALHLKRIRPRVRPTETYLSLE